METPQLRPVRRRSSDLKAREGFLRDSKPLSGEGKTEERTLLSLHHFAFVPVDLYLEDFLKEPADTLHHALCGPFGLHEDDEVIGIPCELMPPFLQFLIEIIQKDITQERRKRPALRHSFGCLIQPAVYDHTGPKIFADQMEDAFVPDSPGDPVHQNVVIDHIEELLKVDVHGIGISSLNKLQHLLDGLMRRTVRPEPETGFGEMGIKDRGENLSRSLVESRDP